MEQNDKERSETDRSSMPRIYVASLADYNAGRLHGRWIDANQDAEAIHAEIAAMLAESSEMVAEDWAIHDYENFGSLRLGEFENMQVVAEVAQLMDEHGTLFAELVANCGGTSGIAEAKQYMEEGYCGAFDKLDDYAQEMVEECFAAELGALPGFISCHIDYECIARNMELSGDVFTVEHEGKVHVFNANV